MTKNTQIMTQTVECELHTEGIQKLRKHIVSIQQVLSCEQIKVQTNLSSLFSYFKLTVVKMTMTMTKLYLYRRPQEGI